MYFRLGVTQAGLCCLSYSELPYLASFLLWLSYLSHNKPLRFALD
jgi:hypothetical protein